MRKRSVGLVLGVLGAFLFLCFSVAANDTIGTAWNLSLDRVSTESVNNTNDRVDWYRIDVSSAGGLLVFAESADFKSYNVGLTIYYKSPYTGGLSEIARDFDMIELKNVGGSCRPGTYYVKIEANYASFKTVSYKIGVAFTEVQRYCSEDSISLYNINVVRNAITWVFLVDESSLFDPDILIFEGERLVGGSLEMGNFDHIRWELIGGTGTDSYKCAIKSSNGSGPFWLFIITYRLN